MRSPKLCFLLRGSRSRASGTGFPSGAWEPGPPPRLCQYWVLRRSYRLTRSETAAVLHRLLAARQLEFAARDAVTRALRRFETGKGDFSDYLIAQQAAANGADRVATFDRALLAESGFVIPE